MLQRRRAITSVCAAQLLNDQVKGGKAEEGRRKVAEFLKKGNVCAKWPSRQAEWAFPAGRISKDLRQNRRRMAAE